jgi:hypothetical protein
MERDALSETIDRLVAPGRSSCADGESMEFLLQELARMEAFVTAAAGAFDASGE